MLLDHCLSDMLSFKVIIFYIFDAIGLKVISALRMKDKQLFLKLHREKFKIPRVIHLL